MTCSRRSCLEPEKGMFRISFTVHGNRAKSERTGSIKHCDLKDLTVLCFPRGNDLLPCSVYRVCLNPLRRNHYLPRTLFKRIPVRPSPTFRNPRGATYRLTWTTR